MNTNDEQGGHSPLPWRTEPPEGADTTAGVFAHPWLIIGQDGAVVAEVDVQPFTQMLHQLENPKHTAMLDAISAANAALIVTAVNERPGLLARAERAEAALGEILNELDEEFDYTNIGLFYRWYHRHYSRFRGILAAAESEVADG
jgi:hypothetical protein